MSRASLVRIWGTNRTLVRKNAIVLATHPRIPSAWSCPITWRGLGVSSVQALSGTVTYRGGGAASRLRRRSVPVFRRVRVWVCQDGLVTTVNAHQARADDLTHVFPAAS